MLTILFYVHTDVFSKFIYLTLRYLRKAFYFNFHIYNTLHHNCIYNRLPKDEPSGSKPVGKIIKN